MNATKPCALIISFLLAAGLAISQQSTPATPPDTLIFFSNHAFIEEQPLLQKKLAPSFDFKSMQPNASLPTYKVTGVFCRMEHRIEATSHFAPRFRLGSVSYTEWMEGKKPLLSRYAK